MTFWSKATPRIESWLIDQSEFLLQIASVAIAYGAFQFLRIIGIAAWVVAIMETLDRIAALLVFGRFLYSVVRRAYTSTEK